VIECKNDKKSTSGHRPLPELHTVSGHITGGIQRPVTEIIPDLMSTPYTRISPRAGLISAKQAFRLLLRIVN
jgi:hypothetical protein